MRARPVCLLAICLMAGCAYAPPANAPRLELEARWRPLVAVVEDPSQESRPSVATTSSPYCYVLSLAAFAQELPAGSLAREAILSHECVHAVRQEENPLWYLLYNFSRSFRWNEEKRGYRVQLEMLVRGGLYVDADAVATFMSGPVYDGMVSHDEALSWTLGVIHAAQEGHP